MSAAQPFNASLDGTPYSFLDESPEERRAERLAIELRDVASKVKSAWRKLDVAAADAADLLRSTFRTRLVYESNYLERLGPDLEATNRILRRLETTAYDDVSAFRDIIADDQKLTEVIGLNRSHEFAEMLARERDRPFTEADLRALHALIVPTDPFAGEYKDRNIEIHGADHVPTDVLDTPRAMRELADWMRSASGDAVLCAAAVHAWVTHIHPFRDGNGRLARILANYTLLRSGYPPLIVRGSLDRGAYLDALAESDEGGDIVPLTALFADSIRRATVDLLAPQRVIGEMQTEIVGGTIHDSFPVWRSAFDEFESMLTTRLYQRGFTLEVFGHPSEEDFGRLVRLDKTGNGWFAKMHSRSSDYKALLWFGYMSAPVRQFCKGGLRFPSLFISERSRDPSWLHPYRPLTDTGAIRIDEITVSPSLIGLPVVIRGQGTIRRTSMSDAVDQLVQAVERHEARDDPVGPD